ncbi:hypothetical protein M5002_10945, partial [Neisseria meningitidis]|nr:hypothetical protein [Neisseria meningitidis]
GASAAAGAFLFGREMAKICSIMFCIVVYRFRTFVRLKAGKHRNESTQRKCRLNMCSGGVLLGGIGVERLKKGFRRSLGVW